MKVLTYEEVYKEWGRDIKIITYKNEEITIGLYSTAKDKKAFFIGYFTGRSHWVSRKSVESIHYDKVVFKFQRFVDEYCTEWQARASFQYKGYDVRIDQERDKEFYIGTVQFHKNSTFKHIADTREEVERCCKNRIGKVIYEKEKVQRKMLTPKQEKIQELEQLLARISTQLEELKKEKDTLTYKGVVLEYGREEGLQEGWMIGRIKNAPQGTEDFYGGTVHVIKYDFEKYIDELEDNYNLYRKLTGKEE